MARLAKHGLRIKLSSILRPLRRREAAENRQCARAKSAKVPVLVFSPLNRLNVLRLVPLNTPRLKKRVMLLGIANSLPPRLGMNAPLTELNLADKIVQAPRKFLTGSTAIKRLPLSRPRHMPRPNLEHPNRRTTFYYLKNRSFVVEVPQLNR